MKSKQSEILFAVLLLAAAAVFNIANYDFPFGYHIDEDKKGKFVETGEQDFHHPLLMLQLSRTAAKFTHPKNRQDYVHTGRFVSGVMGVFLTLFAFLMFRRLLARPYAWLASAAVATSPILIIHAHYLKEDVYVTCFIYLTLGLLFAFLRSCSFKRACLLGVGLGLACSSHFKGALLIGVVLAAPLLTRPESLKQYYLKLLAALAVAAGVFAVINYPMFADFAKFSEGLGAGKGNVLSGQDIRIYAWPMFFGFHLIYSLGPGMTWPVLALCLVGFIWALVRWPKIPGEARVLAGVILLYYISVELTPLKPFPDYSRYVLPVVPGLIFFGAWGLEQVEKWKPRWKILIVTAGTLAVLYGAYDGAQLVRHLDNDTREVAKKWMRESPHKSFCERYVFTYSFIRTLAEADVAEWRSRGFEFLVASSFQYDRYFFAGKLKGQSPEIYLYHQRYQDLFSYPYEEIRPQYRSFAFSNPVVRIVDIRPQND